MKYSRRLLLPQRSLERQKIQELETNLMISRFGMERFSKDNTLVRFYKGFPTYDHYKLFFELVKPTAETMVYVYASRIGTNRPGVRKMQLKDELFILCSIEAWFIWTGPCPAFWFTCFQCE